MRPADCAANPGYPLGEFAPVSIVRGNDDYGTRTAAVGEKRSERPFDHGPAAQLGVLFGQGLAESPAPSGAGHDEPVTHGALGPIGLDAGYRAAVLVCDSPPEEPGRGGTTW